MLVPLFFVTMFALCIIGTYHKPHPNGIKVGVVGPAAQTAPLRAGLEKAAGSAFDDQRRAASVADAEQAVRQRDLDAAFVPTADPEQPATVIVASGGGRLVATAAETLARSVAAAPGGAARRPRCASPGSRRRDRHRRLHVHDRLHDRRLSRGHAPRHRRPRPRAGAAATRSSSAIAILVPTLAYLIGGLGFGTYTGSARNDPRLHRRRRRSTRSSSAWAPACSRCCSGRPGCSSRSPSSCS